MKVIVAREDVGHAAMHGEKWQWWLSVQRAAMVTVTTIVQWGDRLGGGSPIVAKKHNG